MYYHTGSSDPEQPASRGVQLHDQGGGDRHTVHRPRHLLQVSPLGVGVVVVGGDSFVVVVVLAVGVAVVVVVVGGGGGVVVVVVGSGVVVAAVVVQEGLSLSHFEILRAVKWMVRYRYRY